MEEEVMGGVPHVEAVFGVIFTYSEVGETDIVFTLKE